jgi:precorrin-6B methylase 2
LQEISTTEIHRKTLEMKKAQDLLNPPNPSSQELFTLIEQSTEGLKKSYLIMTALEVKVFEHTATPKTPIELSKELDGYHSAMLQLFCEALVEIGLLTKTGDAYANSPLTSLYLSRSSPYYLEHVLENIKGNVNRWTQLQSIIKNGPIPHSRQDFFGDGWLMGIAEYARAGTVAKVLKIITSHLDSTGWRRLLDLGGGHGLYAIAFTALNPQLDAYIFDLPRMVPIARKYIEEYNAERVHILPGDFYKDSIGTNYDVVFSSFNQSCSDPKLIAIMVEALAPEGYLILRRFKDSSREGALKTLDWNLLGFEGKKIGSKSHSSDSVVDQKAYLQELKNAGLTVLGTYSLDAMSEITFAQKKQTLGSGV